MRIGNRVKITKRKISNSGVWHDKGDEGEYVGRTSNTILLIIFDNDNLDQKPGEDPVISFVFDGYIEKLAAR